MTREEFINLNLHERTKVLLASGKYFYERASYGKYIWKYYMIFDFMVESEYSIEGNKVIRITVFEPVEPNSDIIFQESTERYS